ncbi:SWIRM domain-containing protein [Diaporthe helianthi]|uniref:SWIRM domain-containing protein n=1 Tax=Diaporthe helianthi TaxID=158607 RepID=A0A2P5I655_DIAHE|nr:SWIRM domain-containing protein [Diaporthe helianthi]
MANRYQPDEVSTYIYQRASISSAEAITGQVPSSASAPSSKMQPKNPLSISSMISPPEQAPLDSFRQVSEHFQHFNMQPPTKPKQANHQQPPSPPISPWTKADSHDTGTSVSPGVKDPILYPEAPTSPSSPLFDERKLSPAEVHNAVFEHIASRGTTSLPRHVAPPKPQDYEYFLCFTENVYPLYQRDPRAWLRRNREQLLEDAKARAGRGSGYRKHQHPVIQAKPLMARPSNTIIARATAPKHSSPQGNTTKVSKATAGPRPVRAQTTKAARRISSTPEPRSRLVPPNREDKDFNSIPDYCPPLSSLPEKSNLMRVDWKGAPLDLTKDPNRHLLHPDELQLAAGLRLDCATYLTSKRRIFEARLDYYHKGKEFRKTHAQQACKIDVNKASKLHTAYERAGWFEKRWMQDLPVPVTR